jgi:hypothetical protein
MEEEPPIRLVGLLVEMIDAGSVEGGGATLETVDLVSLVEQELGQV